MSRSWGNNRSNSHVHFCIGIPPSEYLTHVMYSNVNIKCVKYSDGGTHIGNCTWLLLLLSPCDCDRFWCWCGRCELYQYYAVVHYWQHARVCRLCNVLCTLLANAGSETLTYDVHHGVWKCSIEYVDSKPRMCSC